MDPYKGLSMQPINISEFSRVVVINDGVLNKAFEVFAEKAELSKLAARFDLHKIDYLDLRYIISEKPDIPGAFLFSARLKSQITKFVIQNKEENLEIDENFDVVFLSAELAKENEEQLKDYDIEILNNSNSVDIGEIAAQYLSLCVFM